MIEFAVAMPVLIILIMYIHDLALMKRYYDQMEFVALQMVSMIQNVSQKRENKAITKNDLRYIVSAAFLTIYPGTAMFRQGKGYVFAHFPHPYITYVKGNADGTASCVWRRMIHMARSDGTKPSQVEVGNWTSRGIGTVDWKTNAVPSSIYPTLKISLGEVKIIAEAIMLGNSATAYPDVNGRQLSVKQMFGFYLLSPKGHKAPTNSNYGYFNSVVIFSPKPGLFSETAPK